MHSAVMTNTEPDTSTLTVRIPKDLADRLKARADELERSVNWMVKNILSRALEAASPAWPSPPDQTSGRSLYGVALRWYMPPFGEVTEERVDIAVARAVRDLQEQGAENVVIDGPWAEAPMTMREPNYGDDVAIVNRYPSAV